MSIYTNTKDYRHTLKVNTFGNLTIIAGTSGAGKNTLLQGFMSKQPFDSNYLVCTESYDIERGLLSTAADGIAMFHTFDVEYLLLKFSNSASSKNLFIEQYTGNPNKLEDTLATLSKYCLDNDNVRIYICINLPKEKSLC